MTRSWERVLTASCLMTPDGQLQPDDHASSSDTSDTPFIRTKLPEFGRPLSEYIQEHGRDAALKRVPYETDFESVALADIRKVCKVGGETDVILKPYVAEVTLSTLNTILKLSQSPLYLRHFESRSLISGCIKILTAISIPDHGETPKSPFSYEYGYMCFKILTIAIGVCLLSRSHKLTPLVDRMMEDQETPMFQLFSNEVSQVAREEIEDTDNNPIACDWILGWAQAPGRPREPPLASRYNIINLLNFISDDCQAFMEAWSSTFPPGISGVMFLLYRFVYNKCVAKTTLRPGVYLVPLCELIWRCMIMATTDEVVPLMYMFNAVQAAGSELWVTSAGGTDTKDSRTILNTFLMRLAPTDPERFSRPGITEMSSFFIFIYKRLRPGCEDLFPRVFEMVLDRTWEAFDTNEVEETRLIEEAWGALLFFSNFLVEIARPCPHKPEALMQLITILAKKRIFELFGKALLMTKYTATPSEASDSEASMDSTPRMCAEMIFKCMGGLVAQDALEDVFRSYIPEWLAINRHITTFRYRVRTDPRSGWDPYKTHAHSWWRVAKCVGLERRIKYALESRSRCSYARCPAVDGLEGGGVTCGSCFKTTYCSVRCQTRDWTYDCGLGSHQSFCAEA
ncbi:unnamed protein product [Rhizoctonia solani]|uniref:MYND-type domain-containing protein n=1 Tax=Rhizoctonia solani TaxID=456999 RepID=A0A8H3HUL8_9AGAM|nr:unnamed protein product [Rhizoctonia solani]